MGESGGIDSSGGRAMPKAYSADIRMRVIARVEGGASRREAAEQLDISPSAAVKWVKYSEAGSFQFSQGPAMPNGSDRPPLKTTSLLAGTTLRRRKIGTRPHTRSLHGPLAARGTSKFSWCRRLLAGPAVRANNSDLRAVRHAELAHDLPNMKFDGTFTHRQPARNDLVRIAIAQEFEDRSLPRCYIAIRQICVFQILCAAPAVDARGGRVAVDRRMPLRIRSPWPQRRWKI